MAQLRKLAFNIGVFAILVPVLALGVLLIQRIYQMRVAAASEQHTR